MFGLDLAGNLFANGTVNTGMAPVAINVGPAGRNVFVSSNSEPRIYVYSVDQSTGLLTQTARRLTAAGPVAIAISGRSSNQTVDSGPLYAIGSNNTVIEALTIDNSSGAPSPVQNANDPGNVPVAEVRHPNGRWYWVLDNANDTVTRINLGSDGLFTMGGTVVATGTAPSAIAVHPGGRYLVIASFGDDTLESFSIDATTGDLTSTGNHDRNQRGPQRDRLRPTSWSDDLVLGRNGR